MIHHIRAPAMQCHAMLWHLYSLLGYLSIPIDRSCAHLLLSLLYRMSCVLYRISLLTIHSHFISSHHHSTESNTNSILHRIFSVKFLSLHVYLIIFLFDVSFHLLHLHLISPQLPSPSHLSPRGLLLQSVTMKPSWTGSSLRPSLGTRTPLPQVPTLKCDPILIIVDFKQIYTVMMSITFLESILLSKSVLVNGNHVFLFFLLILWTHFAMDIVFIFCPSTAALSHFLSDCLAVYVSDCLSVCLPTYSSFIILNSSTFINFFPFFSFLLLSLSSLLFTCYCLSLSAFFLQGNALTGELWVMSKKKVQRFDGTFRDYKKAIRKVVLSGEDHKDV